ncbi:MAG: anthranilate synthase component I family protein [Deltaproteobacteria bacterium]|nr:anthranilate synthase component I family protein [Deltaproteobacteria bacterium]
MSAPAQSEGGSTLEPSPRGALRALAGRPGALLLQEGPITLLSCDPAETLRVEAGEAVLPALEGILADRSSGDLWCLALSYEAGRALVPGGGEAPPGESVPRLLAHRYRAWLELRPGEAAPRPRGEPEAREALLSLLGGAPPVPAGQSEGAARRDLDEAAYAERFARIQEALAAGRYYQLNLTTAHRARWEGDPLAFFERLVGAGELPLRAGYLDAGDRVIASASPELLVEYEPATGVAVSAPIKGTCANEGSDAERRRRFERLRRDPKERAEHIMIVDLVRNDLGRVCRPGSVRPRQLFERLVSGPVQHLVTHVEGLLSPDHSTLELLQALLPGGSVTGAPKIAAMRAIEALEVAPRGYYCGAFGRVGPAGALSLTLPIRTATLTRAGDGRWEVEYPSGGGIVAGASMERELAELELKAARFRGALE